MPRPYMNSNSHKDETQGEEYQGYYDPSIHGLSQKDAEPSADAKKVTEELKDDPPKDLVSGSFNRINGNAGESISDG